MPIFRPEEYTDDRPTLDDGWDRLPIIRRVAGLKLRWIGPLVAVGHDDWAGELSEAAWGHLEGCGWQAAYDAGGDMLDKGGRIRPVWSTALRTAADRLASAGEYSGPEGDIQRWASWLCYEMTEPHDVLLAAATKRGWDR